MKLALAIGFELNEGLAIQLDETTRRARTSYLFNKLEEDRLRFE